MIRIPRIAFKLVLMSAALLTFLGMAASAQAITYCHDYTAYRVRLHVRDNKQWDDPNRNHSEDLRSILIGLHYGRIGNFSRSQLPWRDADAAFQLADAKEKLAVITNFLKPGDVIIIVGCDHSGFVNANGKIDHFIQESGVVGVRLPPEALPTDEQVRINVWEKFIADPRKVVHARILLLRDKFPLLLSRKEIPNKKEFGWFGGLSRGQTLGEMLERVDNYPLVRAIEVWREKPKAPAVPPPAAKASNLAGLWRDSVGREIRISTDGIAIVEKLGRARDNFSGWILKEEVFRNLKSINSVDFPGLRLVRGADKKFEWKETCLTLTTSRDGFSMDEGFSRSSFWTRVEK